MLATFAPDSAKSGPMWIETASEALRKAKVLELRYDGVSRQVEVHAVGYTKAGHPIMRAWQTGGGSKSERVGWKLMRLDEASGAEITSEASAAPRRGYKRGDPAMDRIICEL